MVVFQKIKITSLRSLVSHHSQNNHNSSTSSIYIFSHQSNLLTLILFLLSNLDLSQSHGQLVSPRSRNTGTSTEVTLASSPTSSSPPSSGKILPLFLAAYLLKSSMDLSDRSSCAPNFQVIVVGKQMSIRVFIIRP